MILSGSKENFVAHSRTMFNLKRIEVKMVTRVITIIGGLIVTCGN